MKESELKALVSLLDDEDYEVSSHVQGKIRSLGDEIVPFLEDQWAMSSLDPTLQEKIENIIHELQFEKVKTRIIDWKANYQDDLIYGMWAIASYQYPDLKLDALKQNLDQMYYEIWVNFQPDAHPLDQIKYINSVFFDKFKFGPNIRSIHSSNNSMLNTVLESKKGNPLSLCVIYLYIAQKLGLPIFGVNMPNLFVLTYKQGNHQFYINVFSKGLVFSKFDIDNFIKQLKIKPQDSFYQPCSNTDILYRVLTNLKYCFEKSGETYKLAEIDELQNLLS
ncbi:MAG: transglutaminase family protein [Pseudarcicella sp.]|nr:transglutaminase family protein [Pseudarcicella sp.]MBP6409987.1 transglutaminase family protein [Pseudarcicella sp.]